MPVPVSAKRETDKAISAGFHVARRISPRVGHEGFTQPAVSWSERNREASMGWLQPEVARIAQGGITASAWHPVTRRFAGESVHDYHGPGDGPVGCGGDRGVCLLLRALAGTVMQAQPGQARIRRAGEIGLIDPPASSALSAGADAHFQLWALPRRL